MLKLMIVGASGHGKVIADIAICNGYKDIAFLDDSAVDECYGFPVIGNTNDYSLIKDNDLVIGIGNSSIRKSLMSKYNECNIVSLIHPSAYVSESVKIGRGSVVMPGAVINADTKIGEGCIVNTCASIDHDCLVGGYSHVAVGSHIAGTCNIGSDCWIGAGAVVSNNMSVCNETIIGAGAVVVKDITVPGTYVGCPARKIK